VAARCVKVDFGWELVRAHRGWQSGTYGVATRCRILETTVGRSPMPCPAPAVLRGVTGSPPTVWLLIFFVLFSSLGFWCCAMGRSCCCQHRTSPVHDCAHGRTVGGDEMDFYWSRFLVFSGMHHCRPRSACVELPWPNFDSLL
jgi:hypothetical protein